MEKNTIYDKNLRKRKQVQGSNRTRELENFFERDYRR